MDRKNFLTTMAATALAGVGLSACRQGTSAAGGGRLDALGVQLYTVRGAMEQDVAATLGEVAAVGYREVETAGLFDLSPEQFRAALDAAGLVSPAGHFPIDAIREQPEATLVVARTLGQQWIVVPWLDPAERDAAGYQRLADDLNAFGAAARDAGIRVAYHNHDFEFEPLGDGRTGFDLLLSGTDPSLVDLELDLFWAVKGGHDPIALFAAHPGRFALCHVKDMADIAGSQEMVAVGEGEMDFAGIFAHAGQAGLQHYFVEHDNPSDPVASIRTSFEHLRQLSF
ncbi:MAG: sugar phosphate isomerase/epimerase [Gemmatimonadetes bacterium]|nr:sugar phosphate isomerase/epimerase [Gemmatimonadota bacterium]